VEIIDAHTHLYYPEERRDSSMWPTFDSRVNVLREAGVSRALAARGEPVQGCSFDDLLDRNTMIAAACELSQGFYIPSAEVQPSLGEAACELLVHCREELGMRFLGEMFDRWLGYEWGTPEYYRLLERAVELRMVPLIHCEDEVIAELGQRYPEGRFLIAHLQGVRGRSYEDRIALMEPYGHLYLDISGHDMARTGAIRMAVHRLGRERVVFGSDLGATDPVIAVECVRRSGLTEEQQRLVFAENFKRLWGWTDG
jgi:predicted TIM-barrel fold metal-dependent hydrolase